MFSPGDFTTLVALRTHKGELEAVGHLEQEDAVDTLQPMFELEDARDFESRLDQAASSILRLRGMRRHVMVDASNVAEKPAGMVGVLRGLTERGILGDTLCFIPVVRSSATKDQLSGVGLLGSELGLGCALRLQPDDVEAIQPEQVRKIVDLVGLAPADIDAIVDLRYVHEATDQQTARALTQLDTLERCGTFRSLTLLSGSIPKTLSQISTWREPRQEERLWSSVQEKHSAVRFGDYGVVHPFPGSSYRSKHVNFKYTRNHQWTYVRERIVTQATPRDHDDESDRGVTFRMVCRTVVDSENYYGPQFSWGDRELQIIADGGGRACGTSSKPVAVGTSHHLAYLKTFPRQVRR